MRSQITQEMLSKIERFSQESLDERFKEDGLEFGPIIAIPRVDHYGDEYVQVYIAFEGDQKLLDPYWTGGISGMILDLFEVDELPGIPSPAFIGRDEWEEDNWEEVIRSRATWTPAI